MRATARYLLREIHRAGYQTGSAAADERRSARVELLRVLIAWLMMMQVMMLAVPLYFAAPGDVPADIEQLMRIASLILTLPVILFSAQPLYRAAWSQLRMGSIGMDLGRWRKQGLLRLESARPAVYGLETLAFMHRTIREFRPAAVLVDPITDFTDSLADNKAMLTRLIDFLKIEGITAVFTSLTAAGAHAEQSEAGVSSELRLFRRFWGSLGFLLVSFVFFVFQLEIYSPVVKLIESHIVFDVSHEAVKMRSEFV